MAEEFRLFPAAVYGVKWEGEEESFGMLYAAEVWSMGKLPPFEIQELCFAEAFPQVRTYPEIRPYRLAKVEEMGMEFETGRQEKGHNKVKEQAER